MNYIGIILSSLLCSVSPLMADGVSQSVQSEISQKNHFVSGTEAIAQIRAAYQNGEYDELLTELDGAYKKAKKEGELESFGDVRSALLPTFDQQKWDELTVRLQNEKNQELLKAIDEKDDSIFAEKVRNLATRSLTPEQEAAFAEIAQYRSMAPSTGKNKDANAMIDLDLESEYKTIHLDMPLMQGESIENRREKHIVLAMQKMDRMVQVAQGFEDVSLKQTVESAASGADARLAQHWDASDLNDLSKGKVKPENSAQEKVASILKSYKGKFQDISAQFIETVQQ